MTAKLLPFRPCPKGRKGGHITCGARVSVETALVSGWLLDPKTRAILALVDHLRRNQ